jgi:hypothetical protein
MQLVSESLMTAGAPKVDVLAKRIMHSAGTKIFPDEAKIVSRRVLDKVKEIFLKQQSQELQRSGLNATATIFEPSTGRRRLSLFLRTMEREESYLELTVTQPRLRRSIRRIFVFYRPDLKPFPFIVRASHTNDDLEIRLEDIYPELTHHILVRLEQWVLRQLGRMLKEVAEPRWFE